MSKPIEKEEVTDNFSTQDIPYIPPHKQSIFWPASIFIIGAHIISILGFFTFSWKCLALCLFFHWITGCLGITLGFHRLLTHRSLKVPKILEYFFTLCGTLACQGGPISWVVTHRIHHVFSDEDRDPHSPIVSFFWAHIGWVLKLNPPLFDKKIRERIAPDLTGDPVMRFIETTHIVWTILLGIALYFWGGWPFVIWGIFIRLVFVYHTTWFVNSAAHVWGYQSYRSKDKSTNLWWVALLTFGEGWHNNHHAFQFSARHGLKWWEFDLTYWTIRLLELLGLATAVKIPSARLLESKRINKT